MHIVLCQIFYVDTIFFKNKVLFNLKYSGLSRENLEKT